MKLTLSLPEWFIREVREYAKEHDLSISQAIIALTQGKER